jgi:ribosomal protein L15
MAETKGLRLIKPNSWESIAGGQKMTEDEHNRLGIVIPDWCNDEPVPPYSLCWAYATRLRDFKQQYCHQCPQYKKFNKSGGKMKTELEEKGYVTEHLLSLDEVIGTDKVKEEFSKHFSFMFPYNKVPDGINAFLDNEILSARASELKSQAEINKVHKEVFLKELETKKDVPELISFIHKILGDPYVTLNYRYNLLTGKDLKMYPACEVKG